MRGEPGAGLVICVVAVERRDRVVSVAALDRIGPGARSIGWSPGLPSRSSAARVHEAVGPGAGDDVLDVWMDDVRFARITVVRTLGQRDGDRRAALVIEDGAAYPVSEPSSQYTEFSGGSRIRTCEG